MTDWIITDFEEGEDCIIVTDIPSPKRCKLEPEEILHHKLIPGDGHCIANSVVSTYRCIYQALRKWMNICLRKFDSLNN